MRTRKTSILVFSMILFALGVFLATGHVEAAYDPNVASQYALRYWNGRNPNYKDFSSSGGDCANFVSQCLTAGGLEQTSEWRPYTSYWASAGLIYHLRNIGWEIIEMPSASQISVGDVMIYRWNASGSGYDHVAICSEVINGTPWVCAHTNDRHYSSWTMGAGKYWVAKHKVNSGASIQNHRPRGCFDYAEGGEGNFWFTGWAFDEDTPTQSVQIQVFVGGDAQSGAPRFILLADQERRDVNAAYPSFGIGNYHGFSGSFKTNKRGKQTLYVYAMNTGDGYDVLLGTKEVYISGVSSNITCTNNDMSLNVGETKTFNLNFQGDGIYKLGGHYSTSVCQDGKFTSIDFSEGTAQLSFTGKNPGAGSFTVCFLDSNEESFYSKEFKINIYSPLKRISFDNSSLEMNEGTSQKININFFPANTTDSKKTTWYSSNTSILTIDTDGTILARAEGTAVVTAKVGNYSANCNVVVKKLNHIHKWSSQWSSDDTYHWKNCLDSKCYEMYSLEEHSLSETVVSANPQRNGKKIVACSECDYKAEYKISRPEVAKVSQKEYTYNGNYKEPKVIVLDNAGRTISEKYYSVKYTNNKEVGKANVTITFKGLYSGKMQTTFMIIPKKTEMKELRAKTKGFTLSWNAQKVQTKGYEIQYSKDSKFSKESTVTLNVSNNSTVSKEIKNLSKTKKYYVRIRTYKYASVDGKNTKLCSNWSEVKSVITK